MRRHHHIKTDSTNPQSDRMAAVDRPLSLSDLAYDCEGLVVRDPRLPHTLVRTLLDVAAALREEVERRSSR